MRSEVSSWINARGSSLATAIGENYFLEFKNTLTEGDWTTLPSIPGDGTFKTLDDPSATGSQRIYRVRVE